VFLASLRFPRVRVFEPYVFFLICAIPFLQTPEAIYGFGLFSVGAILLAVDGQLSRKPIRKIALLGAYFLSLVICSSLFNKAGVDVAIGLLIFFAAFFLFLFLTFQEKIIVFVRSDRPTVRLSEKGLTPKESAHLLGLVAGQSVKEIAFAHGVTESTVRNSLSRVYRKLGFMDKAQVLQWAGSRILKP